MWCLGMAGVPDGEHLKESLLRSRGDSGGCHVSEEDAEGLRLGVQEGKVVPQSHITANCPWDKRFPVHLRQTGGSSLCELKYRESTWAGLKQVKVNKKGDSL